jgi:hypothetical protein
MELSRYKIGCAHGLVGRLGEIEAGGADRAADRFGLARQFVRHIGRVGRHSAVYEDGHPER